ncbi:hypothetical protein ACH347_14790 [Saccharopolyspora sp. 5N102]|uniref:hypothetical protein n=1 Tax=Saccharopolyspora sp. 5N102 TaxID=3375155 RepID=UPI0037972F45
MEPDKRWFIGGIVVGGAMLALVLLFVLATFRAADANGALAAVTGTMGTILGAYFGVAAGGAGTGEARLRAEHGEDEINGLRTEISTLHQKLMEKNYELGKYVGRQEEEAAAEQVQRFKEFLETQEPRPQAKPEQE